jgi:inositol 1,4,5-triphosphate receptor type 1
MLWNIVFDFDALYYTTFLVFTILGISLHAFFYAFTLSYIILRSATLKSVLLAIVEPRGMILVTLMFFFMTMYVFSIISYSAFQKYYDGGTCSTLLTCLIINVDTSFKEGLSVFMSQPYLDGDDDVTRGNIDYWRILFDNAFNLIIMILIVELIAGIIIDKFGDLRGRNLAISEDSSSNCFICGEKGDVFDNFEYHIKHSHNMWSYIFCMGYLGHKQQLGISNFSGAEALVLELYRDNQKEQTYFPCYLKDTPDPNSNLS